MFIAGILLFGGEGGTRIIEQISSLFAGEVEILTVIDAQVETVVEAEIESVITAEVVTVVDAEICR